MFILDIRCADRKQLVSLVLNIAKSFEKVRIHAEARVDTPPRGHEEKQGDSEEKKSVMGAC